MPSNQHINTWKLKPGSIAARVVELLRFLPDGTALTTAELCRRIGERPSCGMVPTMSAAVWRGLVKVERRRNPSGLGNTIFWMAGGKADSILGGLHEDIADQLHAAFGGSQRLKATHHGVDIETIRPHLAHWSKPAPPADPGAPTLGHPSTKDLTYSGSESERW